MERKIKKQSTFNEDITFLEQQTEEALRENADIEEILKWQEKEIKSLSMNNTHLVEEIERNAYDIQDYRTGSEELKSNIKFIQNDINQLNNDILIKTENEKKMKKMIEQKDNEIRKYSQILNEMKGEYNSSVNYNKQLENQLKNVRSENSKLNSIIQNSTQKKITQEESLSEVKPELNDVEEENLKEIAGLMKKVLEE